MKKTNLLKNFLRGIFGATLLTILFSGAAHAQTPTVDGTITETSYTNLGTSAGGPTPGFGAGHEINALYSTADAANLFLGIAGNVQNGNRILVFIDSRTGGYNNGDFGRTGAPAGVSNFNSGTTFDTGFTADYVLVIGTNAVNNYFFDLYTLGGTASGGGGSNVFLNTNPNAAVAGNPANSSNTQGFEVRLSRSGSGAGTNLQVNQSTVRYFAAYTSDGGFLSNQFISRANSGNGNYGSGAVNFAAAAPNPVDFNVAANFTVTNTADSGAGSLRQAILDANATVGTDTITFNISGATTIQPASELPPITDPVTIDGYTQSGAVLNSTCGGTATLQIVLNGASAGVAANGLTLGTGSSGSTVRALVINGFDGNGIEIGSSNNQIQGNFIGTSQNGAMAIANNSNGIAVISGTGNTSAEFPPRQPPLPLNGATSFRATAEAVSSSTV